ncbi:hypothetical protein BDZ90DRAFT_62583 [Jaminaea rosea]|uniref:Uncharacterized protein n=1 Tax=Jaminaea rosea TaxID=1569628 RepID=A0A316UPG9_9BASI|nr:hypothetical protein BDZ90DRAFT_62583 [Jaminaea rosea]PWN25773.1 hypothetical protein BDZ90DRAFT_62583 [Jaminaea rosea]
MIGHPSLAPPLPIISHNEAHDADPYGFYDARRHASSMDDDTLEILTNGPAETDNFLSLDLEPARRGRASYESNAGSSASRRSTMMAQQQQQQHLGDDLPGAKARKILGIKAGLDLGDDFDEDTCTNRRRNSSDTHNGRNKKRLSIASALARNRPVRPSVPLPKRSAGLSGSGSSAISDDEGFGSGRQSHNWAALRGSANSISRPSSRESNHSATSSLTSFSKHLRPRHTTSATDDHVAQQRDAMRISSPVASLPLKSPLSPLPPPCDWAPPSSWHSQSPSNRSQSSLTLPTTPSLPPRSSAEGFLSRGSIDVNTPMTPSSTTSTFGTPSTPGSSMKKSSARFDAYLKRLRVPRGSQSSAATNEGEDSPASIVNHPRTPTGLASPSSVSLRELMLWEKSLETSQRNAQWQSMVEHRPRTHRTTSSSNLSTLSSEAATRGTTLGSKSATASLSTISLFDGEPMHNHGPSSAWNDSSSDVMVDMRASGEEERLEAPYPFCATIPYPLHPQPRHEGDEAVEFLEGDESVDQQGGEALAEERPPLVTAKSMPVGLGIHDNGNRKEECTQHPFKSWDSAITQRGRGLSDDVTLSGNGRGLSKEKKETSRTTPALLLSPTKGASSRRNWPGGSARALPQAPLLHHHFLPLPAIPDQTTAASVASVQKPSALTQVQQQRRHPSDHQCARNLSIDFTSESGSASLFDSAAEALLLELEDEIRTASASVPQDSDGSGDDDHLGGEYEDEWLAAQRRPSALEMQVQWPKRPSITISDVGVRGGSSNKVNASTLAAWKSASPSSSRSSVADTAATTTTTTATATTEDGLLIILPPSSSYTDVKAVASASAREVGEATLHGQERVPALDEEQGATFW